MKTKCAPLCAECCHHGSNVLKSTTRAETRLLRGTHQIDETACCHASALITHGTGMHEPAEANRMGFCGIDGRFFNRQRPSALLSRRPVRIDTIGTELEMGQMRSVEVSVLEEPTGSGERGSRDSSTPADKARTADTQARVRMGDSKIKDLELRPNARAHVWMHWTEDGRPVIEDWERAERSTAGRKRNER